jgi:TRAP-type C4-dicarboxylate transport system permease small subunit
MKFLEALNTWIARFETVLIVIILTVMVMLSFLQVLLRNFFDEGLLWGDILLRHLVLWVGFLGASLATRDEKHISIDLFGRLLKKRGKNVANLVTNLFSVFIGYLLTDASWYFVMDEKAMGTTIFNQIPVWYFQIIIPVGFGLITFRFLINAIKNINLLIDPAEGA